VRSLSCRACGAAFTADAVDRRLAIVSCAHCGALFDLAARADRVPTGDAATPVTLSLEAAPSGSAPERAPVPLPDGFTVSDRRGTLAVRWRWFRFKHLLMLFFCVAWDSFLVFWYGIALTQPDTPWLMVVFPLAHVAVGVGLTYATLAGLLNRTTIQVDATRLTVRHGPVPWRPQPTLMRRELEQLYVTREVSRGKNGVSVTFSVRAVTRDHSGLALVKGLDQLDQALWLEQEIERHLDLRDRAVAGELRDRDGAAQL
jgi:hypothetical protein